MNEERKLQQVLKTGNKQLINSYFEEIYDKYKGLVCFVIAKYIKNYDDIIDLAQDVFLSFFNNADKVNCNIKYYLTTTAKNKALNHIKKYNRVSLIDDSELDIIHDKSINNNDTFEYILEVLKQTLTTQEYEILCLHLLDNYTFKKISIQQNINESTVKTLYYRAVKKSKLAIERRNNNE